MILSVLQPTKISAISFILCQSAMKEKNQKRITLVGQRLAELRKQKGLSYRELAAQCDIDFQKISKVEKGKANLSVTTLIEIAEGLGIHPKELLDINFED